MSDHAVLINELRSNAAIYKGFLESDGIRLTRGQTWDIETRAADALEALIAERDEAKRDVAAFNRAANDLREQRDALVAVIERARNMPDRREVVPIEETVRRHAYLKGYESSVDDVRRILSEAPEASLDAVRAEAWEAGHLVHGRNAWNPPHCRIAGGCIAENPYRKGADRG